MLRKGYTTGTCAAAASKAAVITFLSGDRVREVEVTLPVGHTITLPVFRCEICGDRVVASIIKDAGDDPDVTNGAEISSEFGVRSSELQNTKAFRFTVHGSHITVYGGKGVGIVTKPGLAVPVGEPAINPVPRQMIEESVKEVFKTFSLQPSAFSLVISIPNGEEIAKKTMNPRLGIISGLSILGTTGIVEPLSLSAYRQSIVCALDIALASGCREIVLSTGRSSERIAQKSLNLTEESFVLVGDHMGFALKEAGVRGQGLGVIKITIAGQFGKFSKLTAGYFRTHCRDSSIELGFLASLAEESGVKARVIEKIKGANTAREVFYIFKEEGLNSIFRVICERIKRNAEMLTGGKVKINCILVGYDDKIVQIE